MVSIDCATGWSINAEPSMFLGWAGDMDINPETGQYRLSASVPGVEANDLRRTLAIRPTPFPIGGAVRGVLHCTGPLETPVFSGACQGLPCPALRADTDASCLFWQE